MLDQDVRRIEDRLKQRLVVNRDRRTGDTPLTIVQVGDLRFVWMGSGPVAAGGSSTLHLTVNGAAMGEAVFKRAPVIWVGRDLASTAAGVATASGPLSISQDWSLGRHYADDVDVDLLYLGNTKTFAVRVTNNMATEENFVVAAVGVA